MKFKTKTGNWVSIPMMQGADGKSAYQLAVENGFQGTESEWIQSLSATVTVDSEMDENSENPVQNKIILQELNNLRNYIDQRINALSSPSTTPPSDAKDGDIWIIDMENNN